MATTNVQKFAGDVDVGGTVTGDGSGLTTLNGSQVTTGTVAAARIANLDGSKITTGTLGTDRIPSLDAGKITTGTLGTARIPNLDAGKITTGTISRPVDTTGDITADGDITGDALYTSEYVYRSDGTATNLRFTTNTLYLNSGGNQNMIMYANSQYTNGNAFTTGRRETQYGGGTNRYFGNGDSKFWIAYSNYGDCQFYNSAGQNILRLYYYGIAKNGGNFEIKHPLSNTGEEDRLRHSFVEGPRADNIYRGLVQLENGTASVNVCTDCVETLESAMRPGTYKALNKNSTFLLQNTTGFDSLRGSFNEELETLTIESENQDSNAIVSWMVIGERQDETMRDFKNTTTTANGSLITEFTDPKIYAQDIPAVPIDE